MNTFHNFESYNGWVLPGSCWGSCGDEYYYVDANGDVWVPCVCCPEPEAPAAAASSATPPPASIEGRLQYIPNRNGTLVQVGYPEALLYYPGQTFTLGGARYDMGMLADTDKGHRYAYQGAHRGRVRLHVAHLNKTTAKAVLDETGAARLLEGVYPGIALRYAIGFVGEGPATVTILRQGASIGPRGSSAAFLDYLRSPQETHTFALGAGEAKWLFLGKDGAQHKMTESQVLLADIGIAPACNAMEAMLDLEIIGKVRLICCAFHDFSRVDLDGRMFPVPMPQEPPQEPAWPNPTAGLTGVRRHFWGFEGMFSWELDENANNAKFALEAKEEPEPLEVLASRDPWPLNDQSLDKILFYPPIAEPVPERRDTGHESLANRGVLYHQTFVLHNTGELPRRVNYYVESPAGGQVAIALSNHQVLHYTAGEAPQLVAAAPHIAAHDKKIVESWFVYGADAELQHVLRTDEAVGL